MFLLDNVCTFVTNTTIYAPHFALIFIHKHIVYTLGNTNGILKMYKHLIIIISHERTERLLEYIHAYMHTYKLPIHYNIKKA